MPQIQNYDLLTDLLTRVKSRDASASKKHVFCRPYTVVKPNICTYLNILEGEKIFILHTI